MARGERAFQRCFACHSVKPGETDLTGPNLHGLLRRRIAGEQGFDYSGAFEAFAARKRRWTPALLDRFLADPQALVPKNAMGFFGLRDVEERKALIAYLLAQR
jgi:cytochrome c2